VLIHTDDGNIIVDTSLNPVAAGVVKQAFAEAAPPGPVKAIIYTHSHVDHTMGTTAWAENGTRSACPSCGAINSAYDSQCRKCGGEPGSGYVAEHKDEIIRQLGKMR